MSEILELEQPTVIETALQKENITQRVISELKEKYLPLEIKGVDDKAGYKIVDEARKHCKSIRVLASNICKAGREESIKIQKAWIAKEKEVTGEIEAVELACENKLKAIEDEKARIAEEKRIAREKVIADRVKTLLDNGCAYNGVSYTIGELSMSHVILSDCSDDIFLPFAEKAKAQNEIEIAAKLERERLEKEEADRIEAEKQAEIQRQAAIAEANRIEAERLDALRKEQEERQAEIERQQRELEATRQQQEAEAKRLREEAENKLWRSRLDQLDEIKWDGGWAFCGLNATSEEKVCSYDDLITMSDENFGKLRMAYNNAVARRKEAIAEENKRLAVEAEANRLREIEDAKEQARKEEAERLRLAEEERQTQIRAQQEEEARQAALRPDKEKLMALSDDLGKLTMLDLESEAAKAILISVKELISKTQLYIAKQVKSL
jgi:hypothetical protein